MKNPALTGGVSVQFKLRLTRLLLALVPHILPNGRFVDAQDPLNRMQTDDWFS